MVRTGRPKKRLVDAFRARAWYNAVLIAADGVSAYDLEKRFSPVHQMKSEYGNPDYVKNTEPARGVQADKASTGKTTLDGKPRRFRSGIWNKYQRGEAMPSEGPTRTNAESLVQRVEDRYNGTARWLHLPLWDMLDRHPISMEDINRAYGSLGERVRNLFVARNPKENLSFWRLPVKVQDALPKLQKMGRLDAATAVMAMIREAEIAQDQEQHIACFKAWFEMAPSMKDGGISADLLKDILAYTRDWFGETVYSDDGVNGVSGADVIEYLPGAQPPYLDLVRNRREQLRRRK